MRSITGVIAGYGGRNTKHKQLLTAWLWQGILSTRFLVQLLLCCSAQLFFIAVALGGAVLRSMCVGSCKSS